MDELKQQIRQLLEERGVRSSRLNDVMKALGLPPTDKKRVRRLLREMESEEKLEQLPGRTFVARGNVKRLTGTLRTNSKGFGFVVPAPAEGSNGQAQDIFIPRKYMADAMNNDKVVVRITGKTSRNPEGEIIEVVERGTTELVGTFYHTQKGGNVLPRDEKFTRTIITPRPDPKLEIPDGAYVLAEITTWTPSTQPLLGRVKQVLGELDTPGIDITVIVRDAGVDPEFPQEVLRQAESINADIPAHEIARRTDFRNIATFTMDGVTAKDFDDALSIESMPGGGWKLGVHIADVSYYVSEATPLDQEAYERATSIYPIDRVVPMLPEKLSNDLCSLRPNEYRLTISCVMEIDPRGRVHNYSVHEGVIRSAHRLIYEEVQQVMDGTAEPSLARKLGDIRLQLEQLYELRAVLTTMRYRRGALDLDIPETEIKFDPEGLVEGLFKRARLESHRVVEECMLIANEVVATHLYNLGIPSVYRVHEDPDLNKLRQLQPVLAHLGVRFPAKKEITPEAIQAALDMAGKLENGFIARRLILRAMMRAQYSEKNLGHYGLASKCYTHFTSPIRRYPDLLVHRILRETLQNGAPDSGTYHPPEDYPHGGKSKRNMPLQEQSALPNNRIEFYNQHLPTWTSHCSERERRADDIENDAARVKTLEYMRRYLGDEFDSYITSVTSWGLFVELIDMPVEGLIHVRSMTNDFFEYDEERMTLTGQETGETYKLGDKVRIMVQNINLAQLAMDFVIVQKYTGTNSSDEDTARKKARLARVRRHSGRRPSHPGFQARGRKRR